MCARKSYLLDSISQKDPKHLLKMTVDLAELALLMSDHKESMRYALGGLKLAQKEKDKGAEGKLLFCIGENKWQLSFKEEAYDYFDKAIKQLQGAETKLEMAMLSYFYGMKMDYLLNDSRTEEALEVGLKREKLLKSIARLPEKMKPFWICNILICMLKCHIFAIWKGSMNRLKNITSSICLQRMHIPLMVKPMESLIC